RCYYPTGDMPYSPSAAWVRRRRTARRTRCLWPTPEMVVPTLRVHGVAHWATQPSGAETAPGTVTLRPYSQTLSRCRAFLTSTAPATMAEITELMLPHDPSLSVRTSSTFSCGALRTS